MTQIQTFKHPKSGAEIQGRQLEIGDDVEPTDLHDSLNGLWERCGNSLPFNHHFQKANITVVRPTSES